MGYYSAMKKNEALIHATTWMNFENIMPSERNQTQKDHVLYDSISMKCLESIETESRLVSAGAGMRNRE